MNHSLPRRAFVALQYLVPQHLLSRLFGYLAGSRIPVLKDFLIRRFIAAFAVDMREALDPDPSSYADFNAFFTRALAPGARPLDSTPDALVSPADGAISQLGRIKAGRIVQAKGHHYTLTELLAGDGALAAHFHGGYFATRSMTLTTRISRRAITIAYTCPWRDDWSRCTISRDACSRSTRAPPNMCRGCLRAMNAWYASSKPRTGHWRWYWWVQ